MKRARHFLVEELFNKNFGMCYALTPDESVKMRMNDLIFFTAHFEQETKIPPTDVIFTSPEDRFDKY